MADEFRIDVTEQLWLSPIVEADRDQCVELINDPDIERRMRTVRYPYGAAEFDQFLSLTNSAQREHGCPLHLAIRHQQHGFVGVVGFEQIVPGHQLELGYWLGQRYWGRGFMTAAVRAACRWCVDQWNVVRVSAYVFDGNTASGRVLEKAGFECEGMIRRCFRKGSVFIDAHLYAWFPEHGGPSKLS